MTRVVAQGTFDLLHPGHVHYLEDAATYGDELHAIVARRTNVTHKPAPILCAEQRRDMVAALTAVDEAHLGHPEDVFVPIQRLDPDVIVLDSTSTTTRPTSPPRSQSAVSTAGLSAPRAAIHGTRTNCSPAATSSIGS